MLMGTINNHFFDIKNKILIGKKNKSKVEKNLVVNFKNLSLNFLNISERHNYYVLYIIFNYFIKTHVNE